MKVGSVGDWEWRRFLSIDLVFCAAASELNVSPKPCPTGDSPSGIVAVGLWDKYYWSRRLMSGRLLGGKSGELFWFIKNGSRARELRGLIES